MSDSIGRSEVPTQMVDEAKSEATPRAIDLYLIASRLKRMITASTGASLAAHAGDQAALAEQLREFQELSAGIEPLLEGLAMRGNPSDG